MEAVGHSWGKAFSQAMPWKSTEKRTAQIGRAATSRAEKNLPKCDIVTLATLNCLISDGCYATLPVFDFSRFEAA